MALWGVGKKEALMPIAAKAELNEAAEKEEKEFAELEDPDRIKRLKFEKDQNPYFGHKERYCVCGTRLSYYTPINIEKCGSCRLKVIYPIEPPFKRRKWTRKMIKNWA